MFFYVLEHSLEILPGLAFFLRLPALAVVGDVDGVFSHGWSCARFLWGCGNVETVEKLKGSRLPRPKPGALGTRQESECFGWRVLGQRLPACGYPLSVER